MGCGSSTSSTSPESSLGLGQGEKVNIDKVLSKLRWAEEKDMEDVKKICENEQAREATNDVGNRPVHLAAQNGKIEILKLLIDNGASLNTQNNKGNTALHMTVKYDYYDCAKLLMEAGADGTIKNDDGYQAIYGLEGDRILGICSLAQAETEAQIDESLEMCKSEIKTLEKENINLDPLKVEYTKVYLKGKRNGKWTDTQSATGKEISQMLISL